MSLWTFLIPLGIAALVVGIGVWLSRIPEEEPDALTDDEREKLLAWARNRPVAVQQWEAYMQEDQR